MQLSKTLRRLITATVAVLYLACQGMVTVYARPVMAAQSKVAEAPVSCHETGQPSDGTDTKQCEAPCQSQNSSSTQSSMTVFATTDLPAITTTHFDQALVADSSSLPEAPLLQVEPPPLRILNCCLRN